MRPHCLIAIAEALSGEIAQGYRLPRLQVAAGEAGRVLRQRKGDEVVAHTSGVDCFDGFE